MHEDNITKSILFGCFEPNEKRNFLSFFLKQKHLSVIKQFELHKNNLKQTWTLIRDVIGCQTKKRENLPNFFRQNKDILNDPKDIANGFNDFFAGIGPQLAEEIGPTTISYKSYLQKCDSIFRFSSVSKHLF